MSPIPRKLLPLVLLAAAGQAWAETNPWYNNPSQLPYRQMLQPAQAKQPGRSMYPYYPQPQEQFRPQTPAPQPPGGYGNQRQMPQYPYQQPGGYQNPYAQVQPQRFDPPRLDTQLSDLHPYQQQSLVYRVKVSGPSNFTTDSPEFPATPGLVIKPIGKPETSSVTQAGKRIYLSEFKYLLIPLTAGSLEIPAPRVQGHQKTGSGASGQAFKVAGQPLRLEVRAPPADVQPWMPLYDLRVKGRILDSARYEAGSPLTLEITVEALGITGNQIPPLAPQIEGKGYRVYPGQAQTEGEIASDGSMLIGRRTQTFTLVPEFGGWLDLPTLHLDWWNLVHDRREVASLPGQKIRIEGPLDPNLDDSLESTKYAFLGDSPWALAWLPLALAVLWVLYSWYRAIFGNGMGRKGIGVVGRATRNMLGELYEPVARYTARLSPRRHFHRLRTWVGRNLPISWKLWYCLRTIQGEDDPAEWGQALQILAFKHLGVRRHANLRLLARAIAGCHPRADARELQLLMSELDAAIYGAKPIPSFARWKREFRRQIKPSLLGIRVRNCQVQVNGGLPPLNPT